MQGYNRKDPKCDGEMHTQERRDGTERHDEETDEEVCNGEREQEVVGNVLQSAIQTDGKTDEDVADAASHNEDEHEEETPFIVWSRCAGVPAVYAGVLQLTQPLHSLVVQLPGPHQALCGNSQNSTTHALATSPLRPVEFRHFTDFFTYGFLVPETNQTTN